MAGDHRRRGIVLVVDDDVDVRALARRILEGSGYGVVEAGDGAEALDLMKSSVRIDFLIADRDTPVMRGEAMAQQIHARRPDLRVVYMTTGREQLFKERPELIDGEAFLDKPFTGSGLLEALSLLEAGDSNEAPAPAAASPIKRLWKALTGGQPR